jgi:hypothetical protein
VGGSLDWQERFRPPDPRRDQTTRGLWGLIWCTTQPDDHRSLQRHKANRLAHRQASETLVGRDHQHRDRDLRRKVSLLRGGTASRGRRAVADDVARLKSAISVAVSENARSRRPHWCVYVALVWPVPTANRELTGRIEMSDQALAGSESRSSRPMVSSRSSSLSRAVLEEVGRRRADLAGGGTIKEEFRRQGRHPHGRSCDRRRQRR